MRRAAHTHTRSQRPLKCFHTANPSFQHCFFKNDCVFTVNRVSQVSGFGPTCVPPSPCPISGALSDFSRTLQGKNHVETVLAIRTGTCAPSNFPSKARQALGADSWQSREPGRRHEQRPHVAGPEGIRGPPPASATLPTPPPTALPHGRPHRPPTEPPASCHPWGRTFLRKFTTE